MRILSASFAVVLAGCVAYPQPSESPVALPAFDSPLPQPEYRVYAPWVVGGPIAKKGVSFACGYDDMARMGREVAALNVSWIWNWSTDPPLFPGVESVPCVWDGSHIGKPLGGNSRWVLGPNECEQEDQCNTSPEVMAALWPQHEAANPGKLLTSPQVVRPDARWLERFYAAYQAQNDGRPPRMDAIAIHTYWWQDRGAYQDQVEYYIGLAQQWGVPEVWVTEFTLAPELDNTLQETLDELQAYITWLEAQPMVTRYSIWTNRTECNEYAPDTFYDTPLFAANGRITPMGRMYSAIAPAPVE